MLIFLFVGGKDDTDAVTDEILEFDPLTGQWKPNVARMLEARADHAVSVIDFDSGLCVPN